MTTTQSLLALYRATSTRYHAAITTEVETGDTCTLVVLGDGADWEDGVPAAYYARQFFSIAKGTSVGQWQSVPVTDEIAAAIASAVSGGLTGYATTSYVTAAVAGLATTASVADAITTAEGYAATGDAGRCAVPAAGTSVSLALSTPRRASTTRPTRVTVYGTIALTSTLLTAQNATVELQADSSSTPTTTVGGPLTGSLSGVAASSTVPFTLSYDLPTGHYYQVVQTAGAGTVTITHVNETAM